jgi:hypothetical protein
MVSTPPGSSSWATPTCRRRRDPAPQVWRALLLRRHLHRPAALATPSRCENVRVVGAVPVSTARRERREAPCSCRWRVQRANREELARPHPARHGAAAVGADPADDADRVGRHPRRPASRWHAAATALVEGRAANDLAPIEACEPRRPRCARWPSAMNTLLAEPCSRAWRHSALHQRCRAPAAHAAGRPEEPDRTGAGRRPPTRPARRGCSVCTRAPHAARTWSTSCSRWRVPSPNPHHCRTVKSWTCASLARHHRRMGAPCLAAGGPGLDEADDAAAAEHRPACAASRCCCASAWAT